MLEMELGRSAEHRIMGRKLPVAEAGTKEGNSIFLERSKFLFDCYNFDTKWYVGSYRNTW